MTSTTSPSRWRRAALVLAVLLSLMSVIQGHHRAKKGRNALLKWAPVFEAVESGEPIYETGAEGYPTLPVTLLLMRPFHALGRTAGPIAWAIFRLGLAWWIVLGALRLAFGTVRDAPTGALWLVLLGSFRVLHSEIQHANINLLVGAAVLAGLLGMRRERDVRGGLWLGFAAALKVTPALALVWLVGKRSGRGCLGFGAGLLLGVAAPCLWLGPSRTADMTAAWTRQMLVPYVEGRELTLLQTEHINQSLLGTLSRQLTDAVAIPERTPRWPSEPLRIGWANLAPTTFRAVHLLAAAIVLAALVLSTRRGRGATRIAGEGALLALAMLLLSERSWKHHHVLLPLPLAFLCAAWLRDRPGERRLALVGLTLAGVFFAGSGEAFLGKRGADLAEAWGAYTAGDLVLFATIVWILVRSRLLTGSANFAGVEALSSPPRQVQSPGKPTY